MNLKICILARLIFFSCIWNKNEDNSYGAIYLSQSYKLLLGDFATEDTTDIAAGPADCRETLRILWELKSRHILDVHWNNPWSHSYRCDIGIDARNFLDTYHEILKTLTWAEHVALRFEAYKYAAQRNSDSLCKLLKLESLSRVSPEIRTVENGSGETGI